MASEASLLSEVRFGAFLQYSPRGESEISRRSRRWRDAIKTDTPGSLRRVAGRLAEDAAARDTGLVELLSKGIGGSAWESNPPTEFVPGTPDLKSGRPTRRLSAPAAGEASIVAASAPVSRDSGERAREAGGRAPWDWRPARSNSPTPTPPARGRRRSRGSRRCGGSDAGGRVRPDRSRSRRCRGRSTARTSRRTSERVRRGRA